MPTSEAPALSRRALLAAALALPTAAQAATPVVAGTLHSFPNFPSRHVIPRDVSVWTPPGYDPKGPPLPVLYMQDGQNLYEPSHSLSGHDWGVDRTLSRLIGARAIPPVIVVGLASTALRGREYLPAKIVERLSPATRKLVEDGWKGAPLSDAYLRFMVEEAKPFVETRFNARRDAGGARLVGSSMGGLISLYGQSEYPGVFSGSASLSMHWLLGEPTVMMGVADQAALQAEIISAFTGYLSASRLRPNGHRVYVDCGDQTLDAYYGRYVAPFRRYMAGAGWTEGVNFTFPQFPGAAHTESAWADRLGRPVTFLL